MIDRKPLNASLTAVKKAFPKAKPKRGSRKHEPQTLADVTAESGNDLV